MKPLTHGSILVVGAKASNLPDSLRNNPRLIMWDSQDERWRGKELPQNVKAVFTTRWIGHNAFSIIMTEARKKKITVFPCEGTGQIIRQVTELLTIPDNTVTTEAKSIEPIVTKPVEPIVTKPVAKETTVTKGYKKGKLTPLVQFIDPTKGNSENAKILFAKSKELGIETTFHAMENLYYRHVTLKNRQSTPIAEMKNLKREPRTSVKSPELDAAVVILDEMIKGIRDMREFLIATTEENKRLKQRIDKFSRMLSEDGE